MDALKLVRQIFFDAIARVVPGSAAILLFFLFFNQHACQWRQFIFAVLGGGPFEKEYPISFVVVSLLFVSYLAGHLISPFVKMVQWIGERFPLQPTNSRTTRTAFPTSCSG